MQSHLGSVVWCLVGIVWLGLKFLELLRDLWWKCTTSAECKTNRLVVLTVKSGLDPHMINLWKSMINLMHLSLFMLLFSYVNCGFGINLHLLVFMLLIKLDQLKCWMLKPTASTIKPCMLCYVSACWVRHVLTLVFIIATTQSGCCSDLERFEDFPGDFDEF